MGDVVYFPPQKLTREPEQTEQPTRIQATMSGGRVNGHEWRTLSFKGTNGSNLELTLRTPGNHDMLVGNKIDGPYKCAAMAIDDQVLRDIHDQIEVYFARKRDLTLQGEVNELNHSG